MPKGASSATARQRSGAVTFARLTPYLRGIIYGLRMADYGVQDIIKEVEKADGAPLEGNHNRTPSSRDITNVTTSSVFRKTRPSMLRASPDTHTHHAPDEPTLKGAVLDIGDMVTLVMSRGVGVL